MTDYEPKPCAECGTTYTPKRKNNIYCSGKCADKVYNRKRREKAQETSRQWRKDNADRARNSQILPSGEPRLRNRTKAQMARRPR